ncbi:MAG: YqgE/AlgH family protein [Bacteroidetes bacterium]|nr:MAG: YqgE/AlgH family protein [Bacteroidota bacterium]MBL1145011.1 YqgE/AlgH family protein [Bacteroidota bacterium]NOG57808.1 YqgE/AlgH family protein [Bacteroidota bacterium]
MEFNPFKHKISELNSLEAIPGNALLAEPFLIDPYFKRSVILMVENNEAGAIGFVLNNPLEIKVHDLVSDFPATDFDVFVGGPVESKSLFYIHNKPDLLPGCQKITEELYWNGDFEILKAAIRFKHIKKNDIKFFLGYSGWGKEQLINELKADSWFISKISTNQVFDIDYGNLWYKIMSASKREIAIMANFPEDPSLN